MPPPTGAAAAPPLAPDEAVLYLGRPGKDFKKPRLAHVVVGSEDGTPVDIRLAAGAQISGVPRARLCTKAEADPATFAAAEGAAQRARTRKARAAATAAAALADAPTTAPAPPALSIGDAVLYLGPPGTDFKKPRLVHVVGAGLGAACDVRQATGVEVSGVPRARLRTSAEADPAAFAAAELTAQTAARRAAAPAARRGVGATSLAPSADRLVQIAEAAQDAMRDITARTVCAVCCCTVQETTTVPVVVTDEPPAAWHAKLKATPAMGLHAELRAQYTIGGDTTDVHPRWTEMCGTVNFN